MTYTNLDGKGKKKMKAAKIQEFRSASPITKLAELHPDALLSRGVLAAMLGCSEYTIDRMVKRGELPKPVRWGGGPAWRAGGILDHFKKLETEAAKERDKFAAKILKLQP